MIQMSGFLGFWDSDHYYEGNNTMTIRDRIFARISELEITQKEFAKRTGIPETTVSDWKKKGIGACHREQFVNKCLLG